jgi:Ca2+-binding EF-hand superfamily protein
LAAIFAEFDKDKSGYIDIREFKAIYLENCEEYDES